MVGGAKSIAALAAVILGLIASGCGSDEGGGQAGSGGGQAGSGESPKYGGTLVVAATGDPGVLNPAITSAGTTHPVTGQIFNGLVRLDREFEPQPDLARGWEVSSDGRTYTFKLARARWHDGRPLTSADVKYTFENVLLELHPRTRILDQVVEDIQTPDDQTVVFRLKRRYTPFLKFLDEDNGAILPKHRYQGTDPLTSPANDEPVGTGPFKVESIRKGDQIVLVRNDGYFKEGLPYLDRIVFRVLPPPAALQAFQAGQVDYLPSPAPPDIARLKNTEGVVVTEKGREGFARVIRLIPNLRREPFDDLRVRRAMAHALDLEFIAKAAYAGTLKPATGPLSREFERFYTNNVPKYPYDPPRARRLLDQAGLDPKENGLRFSTTLIYDPSFARTAQLVKEQLREVGIELDLQVMEFQAWVKKLYIDKDFELGYSQVTDPADPDIGLRRIWTCSNIVPAPFTNGAGYCNRRVDRLFTRAATMPPGEQRVDLYKQIQQLIVRDEPHIFLVDGIGPYIYKDEFTGFAQAGSKAPYYFGETVWSQKGSESPGSR